MVSEQTNPNRKVTPNDIETMIWWRDRIAEELERVERGQTIIVDNNIKN